MRPRKGEVEAMVALLDAPASDIDQLAKDALALAWDAAADRDQYGVVVDQPGVGVSLHGPFASTSEARRFLDRFPFAGPHRPRVLVQRMTVNVDTTEGVLT